MNFVVISQRHTCINSTKIFASLILKWVVTAKWLINQSGGSSSKHIITVAKNTATAAQTALGPSVSHRWLPKGRPLAAAGRRSSATPTQNFKIVIQFTNGQLQKLSVV